MCLIGCPIWLDLIISTAKLCYEKSMWFTVYVLNSDTKNVYAKSIIAHAELSRYTAVGNI